MVLVSKVFLLASDPAFTTKNTNDRMLSFYLNNRPTLAKIHIWIQRVHTNHEFDFRFTYQKKIWTNTFNTTTDPTGAVNYPDDGNVFLQWVQGWLGGVITSVPFFNAIPG